jgi:hypothetical protein
MESKSPTSPYINKINSLNVPSIKRPPSLLIEKCAFPGQAVKVLEKRPPAAEGAEIGVPAGDGANHETKVEIQITKDGIKVISDKETTV